VGRSRSRVSQQDWQADERRQPLPSGVQAAPEEGGASGFTFHSLRHTCATLLCSKNVNPKIIQEMMGHATISQTMDTYSSLLPSMQDEAAAALSRALS
jgi:integrase